MAVAYAQVLKALDADFVCVGRGETSARKFREATGVSSVTGGLDAVPASSGNSGTAIVAVPVTQLAEATRRLVDAGYRKLLAEKPGGLDAREIAALASDCSASGAQIYIAYNRRFYASVETARKLIAEDGGVLSWHLDFSELESRLLIPANSRDTLANWFYANATHMLDLGFHLGGEPNSFDATVIGEVSWHKPAAFAGQGSTSDGALFTWHADWRGPGRWGLDVRTRKRRLILQPLEELSEQGASSFGLKQVAIPDDLDRRFKPGLFRQTTAFLSDAPERSVLLPLMAHAARLDVFETIRRGGTFQLGGRQAVSAS